jgi:hypothetical protein
MHFYCYGYSECNHYRLSFASKVHDYLSPICKINHTLQSSQQQSTTHYKSPSFRVLAVICIKMPYRLADSTLRTFSAITSTRPYASALQALVQYQKISPSSRIMWKRLSSLKDLEHNLLNDFVKLATFTCKTNPCCSKSTHQVLLL